MSHILPPGSGQAAGALPGDDPEAADLVQTLQSLATSPGYSDQVHDLAKSVLNMLPPGATHDQIKQAVYDLFFGDKTAPPLDVYITMSEKFGQNINVGDLNYFLYPLYYTSMKYSDAWTFGTFNPTDLDLAFQQLYPQAGGFSGGAQALAQDYLNQILTQWGSGGSGEGAMDWLEAKFYQPASLIQNYPNLSASQLELLIESAYPPHQIHGPPSADFATKYSQVVAYFQTLDPNSDNYRFAYDICMHLIQGWPTSSLDPATQFFQSECSNWFDDYPGLTEGVAVQMETICGFAVPPLQSQLFELKSWIAGPPPLTGPDLDLANALKDGMKNLWPAHTPDDLKAWFNDWNASKSDIYMSFPLASDGAIAMVSQIIGTSVPPKTPMDTLYLQICQYAAAHFQPGTRAYALFSDAANVCSKAGSHAPDLSAFASWLSTQTGQYPPFKNYQPLEQKTITTLISFEGYKPVLEFYEKYLVYWMGIHPPAEEQMLGTKMRSIISAYLSSTQNPNPADFQNYLQTYFSDANHDLCIAIPGLAPWVIYQMFADMGLQNPHTYSLQDYAYAGVCQALAKLSPLHKEPDYDLLTGLTASIKDAIYDPSKWPQVVQAVYNVVHSPTIYDQLQSTTQGILDAILHIHTP